MKAYITILSFSMSGWLISETTNIPIPGSIVGLLMMLIFISTIGKNDEDLKKASETLLKYLPLFLIPIGVSIVELLNGDLLILLSVVIASIISLLIAVISTIIIMKLTFKLFENIQLNFSK